MLSSSISTIVLIAIASVNATPAPQFALPNRLPANGNFPFGLNYANSTAGGNALPFAGLFSFLRGLEGNTATGTGNTTTNNRPFPFNFLPFKRDGELEARDPQLSFNFPNRLPVTGKLPFGLNIGQGANGNSIANFGNATTGDRGFPFNFLPFKRDEVVKRDPQFSFNFPNRLPVTGNLPFGINIAQGANGNSIGNFGNVTTGNRGFLSNFLPFKREEEVEARAEIEKRDPQFSFNFPNRLPVTGNLPFGINIAQGANGNSIGNFGNATTGARPFPFSFLPFKRED